MASASIEGFHDAVRTPCARRADAMLDFFFFICFIFIYLFIFFA